MKARSRARRRAIGAVFALSLVATVAVVVVTSNVGARGAQAATPSAGADARVLFAVDVDALDRALGQLRTALGTDRYDPAANAERVRAAFRHARSRYKHVEAILEFYSPALAAALNSRRQEVDDDDQPPPSTLAASGFPALERTLWPATPDAQRLIAARGIVDGMRATITRMRWLDASLAMTDPQLVEVARLELVRLSTLGIAGFDAPTTGAALIESADALDALRELFRVAGPTRWPTRGAERAALDRTLDSAAAYLRAHADFASADRLTILVDHLIPAARALDALRTAAHVPPLTMPRPLRAAAATPYDADAFDPFAYAPSGAPRTIGEVQALGARLFADPRLSAGGARSCASCHRPDRAFADGLPIAGSIDPHGARVARNTPTLVNAALQPSQFADERAASLEDQIGEVLRSPAEMGQGSSVDAAAAAIGRDPEYRARFASAFDVPATSAARAVTAVTPVTPLRLRQALASYVRTLVALDSRFDRAVRGDSGALSTEERHGFTVFMGKAGCGTCHFAPLFSGDMPPLYRSSDVEVIGTPRSPSRPTAVDADSGRARIDHLPTHLRAFKTPTLRNIALTAPYMHNGGFRTLDEVVRFYDAGGAQGAGAAIANQTLAPDSLHLTPSEQRAIVAFLRTLTDTSYLKRSALKR